MPVSILALGGGMMGALGSLSAGTEGKAAGEFNAQIEDNNAQFARAAGEERAQQIIKAGDMARSTTRARASASGLVADTGSPLLVQQEDVYQAALDAEKARYAGEVDAYGHASRARLYRLSGNQKEKAGQIGAASSLLYAGASAYANRSKTL